MPGEIRKFDVRPVNKTVYEDGRDRRIPLDQIRYLGNYVVRHLIESASRFYAIEIPIRIVKLAPIENYLRISPEARDLDGQYVKRSELVMNSNGFLIEENGPPPRYKDQPVGLIEVGYLAGSLAEDPFDSEFLACISKSRELVNV